MDHEILSIIAKIIHEVEAAGGHLAAKGGHLEVSAPAALPSNLVNDLRQHKSGVMEHLTHRPRQWTGEDFRDFYEERAGVLEYDGKLSRPEAERQAFEGTLIQWINVTAPPNLDDDHCAQCGAPVGRIGNDAVPVLAGGGGHVWLHHGCHTAWMARRKREAAETLRAMGIAL